MTYNELVLDATISALVLSLADRIRAQLIRHPGERSAAARCAVRFREANSLVPLGTRPDFVPW
jgi:hypothetical protein